MKESDARRVGCPARRLGVVGVPCDASLSFVRREHANGEKGT